MQQHEKESLNNTDKIRDAMIAAAPCLVPPCGGTEGNSRPVRVWDGA